jgi:putative tributyrin esterase
MRLRGTFYSKVLQKDTDVSFMIPDGTPPESGYKAVYLLHGLGGNNSFWIDYSLLPLYALNSKSIYIMPDAGRSFYTDMKYGFRYFTYITEELPQLCSNIFKISPQRSDTYVMGGSMGGYGALKCAFARPDLYCACAAFSPAPLFLGSGAEEMKKNGISAEYIENFGEQLPQDFRAAFGENYEYAEKEDLLVLAEKAKAAGAELPELYLTCGTEDIFYHDYKMFCGALTSMNIKYEVEEWQAKHEIAYFNDALARALTKFNDL